MRHRGVGPGVGEGNGVGDGVGVGVGVGVGLGDGLGTGVGVGLATELPSRMKYGAISTVSEGKTYPGAEADRTLPSGTFWSSKYPPG